MVPPLYEGERTNFSTCFKEMSATIFLRRLWKILQLTISIRPPNLSRQYKRQVLLPTRDLLGM
jgi:hypothetical protein